MRSTDTRTDRQSPRHRARKSTRLASSDRLVLHDAETIAWILCGPGAPLLRGLNPGDPDGRGRLLTPTELTLHNPDVVAAPLRPLAAFRLLHPSAPTPRGDPRPSCSQDRPSTKHRVRAGARCGVILPISLPPHRHVDAHSHVVHWSRGQRERHRIPVSQLHVPCYTRQVRHHPVHPNMLRHGKLHSYLHPAAPVL